MKRHLIKQLLATVTAIAISVLSCVGQEDKYATPKDIPNGAMPNINFVAVMPVGGGHFRKIPFASKSLPGESMKFWKASAEPILAPTDFDKQIDINLFSLCGVILSPSIDDNSVVTVTIDLAQLSAPDWIKISKREVVTALLSCLIENTRWGGIKKPAIKFMNWPWDNKSKQKLLMVYDEAGLGALGGLLPNVITPK